MTPASWHSTIWSKSSLFERRNRQWLWHSNLCSSYMVVLNNIRHLGPVNAARERWVKEGSIFIVICTARLYNTAEHGRATPSSILEWLDTAVSKARAFEAGIRCTHVTQGVLTMLVLTGSLSAPPLYISLRASSAAWVLASFLLRAVTIGNSLSPILARYWKLKFE